MKPTLAAAHAFFLAAALSLTAPARAAETYALDPLHSAVIWKINHLGFSDFDGKFVMVEGSVTLDEEKPENSKVSATIRIDRMVTGVAPLDEHLRSKDFFDVASFPTASFVSEKVEITGERTAKVTGPLTLRGVTRPVTLDVALNKLAPNMKQQQTAGFTATTVLKRSDFGMTAYLPALGDDVRIRIESEANKL